MGTLGVYLLAIWAAASTFFVGIAIGVDLIFDSAGLIAFAAAIHSLPSAQSSKTALSPAGYVTCNGRGSADGGTWE